jgi:hypothetical protein
MSRKGSGRDAMSCPIGLRKGYSSAGLGRKRALLCDGMVTRKGLDASGASLSIRASSLEQRDCHSNGPAYRAGDVRSHSERDIESETP